MGARDEDDRRTLRPDDEQRVSSVGEGHAISSTKSTGNCALVLALPASDSVVFAAWRHAVGRTAAEGVESNRTA